MKTLTEVAKALERRGYQAFVMTKSEAAEYVKGEMARAANVGWGGSESVKALGLRETAAEMGKEVRDHRTDCDLFLLSANALLEDGRIVNIDGTGNRIAASVYGPKRVVYIVGSNKLVAGGFDEAVARIRREACPPNARRLGRKTPCAAGGCNGGCDSPDRMCKVIAVFERAPSGTPSTVLLVDEPLGY